MSAPAWTPGQEVYLESGADARIAAAPQKAGAL